MCEHSETSSKRCTGFRATRSGLARNQLLRLISHPKSGAFQSAIRTVMKMQSPSNRARRIPAAIRPHSRPHPRSSRHKPDMCNSPAHTEAQFRTIFNQAAIGIALVDFSGRPQQCNPALEKLLGYSEAELCQMTFPEFTHPDDLQADLDLYTRLVAGEQDHYQLEKRYIRKDGKIVWTRLTISLV